LYKENVDEDKTPVLQGGSWGRGAVSKLLVPLLTMLATLPVLMRHISRGEFNYNVDETQHACTGQFVADLLRDHPIHHLIPYTYLYYVHYPALSGVVHWPPLFYLVEGAVFLGAGASVVTARLSVLLFAVIGLWFWFRLIEKLHSQFAAVVVTLLLAFSPCFLLFEKTVMLEIPSAAMCIVASYFWISFLKDKNSSSLYWFAVAVSLAMLSKQNAVYLVVFCLMSILALKKWDLLWHKRTIWSLLIIVCLAGPYYFLLSSLHWSAIAGDLGEKQVSLFQQIAYYWIAVPSLVGWPLLLLALAGMITCFLWNSKENNVLFFSWILSVYLVMTLIGHKEQRYVIYLVPAVIYFAVWPLLYSWPRSSWVKVVSYLVLLGVGASTIRTAWRFERPYVSGFAPVARAIRGMSDSGVVLVDTEIPANLIFFMRNEDPQHRFVLLRKALYSVRIKEELGSEEYMHTPEELKKLMRDDGIRFIVVSNRPPDGFPVERVLRDFLDTPQFRLVNRFPVEGNSPEWTDYYLSLYENLDAGPPAVPNLVTPMMTLDHNIVTPFEELGITPLAQAPDHR
jgi:Dolichyl-phosphate-mannose-protein mannosyltransferase